jgi:hypothetical protein
MNKLTIEKLVNAGFVAYLAGYLLSAFSNSQHPFISSFNGENALIAAPFILAFAYTCRVGWKLLCMFHEKLFSN